VDRVALQTTEVKMLGKDLTCVGSTPLAGLVFDKAGKALGLSQWIGPRTYVRAAVTSRVRDNVVILSVASSRHSGGNRWQRSSSWGAELGIAGKH
jgi:hypothetical protein